METMNVVEARHSFSEVMARVAYDGAPLPDSGETLAHLREERVHEPDDLR